MSFDEIIGHNLAVKALKKAIVSNKVNNSYIFEGPEGVGKFMTAMAMAISLVGARPDIQYHPDINVLQTDERTIKVDAIRQMRLDINIMPYKSDYKVYIIRDAEKMTVESQNAFLKVLEEPPLYGVIILVCNNINALLPTIKSRCIIYHFGPLNEKDIHRILEKKGIEHGRSLLFARLSGGSVTKAMLMARSEEYAQLRDVAKNTVIHIIRKEKVKSLEDEEKIQSLKDYTFDILILIQSWYMDFLYAKLEMYDIIANKDMLDTIKDVSLKLSWKGLVKSIEVIELARFRIRQYVNTLSSIGDMLMSLQELI